MTLNQRLTDHQEYKELTLATLWLAIIPILFKDAYRAIMNAPTPSRSVFVVMGSDPLDTPIHDSHPSEVPQTYNHHPQHISELSALPRSPEEPLTPPDSDPFKKRSARNHTATTHHQTPSPPDPTPTTTEENRLNLIAEQQWDITTLTSQRALDRQSISRLEADRERMKDYQRQRDGHRSYVIKQWANGIEEIARKDRFLEEFQESEKVRFEKQVQDSYVREESLRLHVEELQRAVGRMEGVAQERAACEEVARVHMVDAEACLERLRVENGGLSELVAASSRRELESETSSRANGEVARIALAERHVAHVRNEELELIVGRLKGNARRFWGSAGSLLAALVMVAVLVESC